MRNFIVIKSYISNTFIGDGDKYPVWQKVTPMRTSEKEAIPKYKPYYARYTEISKEEALELIERHGLVKVEKNANGVIYDTPDRAFQEEYKGQIYYGCNR